MSTEISRVINPNNSNLIVFYPGAGYDIKNPLKNTNGQLFVFVDKIDPVMGTVREQIGKIISQIENMDGQIISQKFIDDKKYTLTFYYQNKKRRLVYYCYANIREITPAEIKDGYDVYFSKGSGPFHYPDYLSKMINLLNLNGYILTYNCDFIKDCIINNGCKLNISINFPLNKLGLSIVSKINKEFIGQVNVQHENKIELVNMPLNRPATIIKKTIQYNKSHILNILRTIYIDLAFLKIESHIREIEKDNNSFFATNSSWLVGLNKNMEELNYLINNSPDKNKKILRKLKRLNIRYKQLQDIINRNIKLNFIEIENHILEAEKIKKLFLKINPLWIDRMSFEIQKINCLIKTLSNPSKILQCRFKKLNIRYGQIKNI